MPVNEIMAFSGTTSQTGRATRAEFPGISIATGKPTFADIANAVGTMGGAGVLPMWNSHVGEIKESQALELLFQRAAMLFKLWPASICFECLSRHAPGSKKIQTIISVGVAAIQCSKFISETGATFIGRSSTVDAYQEFRDDPRVDAALCTPEQNTDGFTVLSVNAANPLNFTTFAMLGPVGSQKWLPDQWGVLHERLFPAMGVFFGVEMPIRMVSLSEDQQQLLNDLTSDAARIDDIPKVVFVSRRREDSCGLLVETNEAGANSDVITEDGYSSKVTIIPEIGVYNEKYSERAYEYLAREHTHAIQRDFVRHLGTQTCFFACPPLQLITHGFEQGVVEPVVRRILTKYFELYLNGMDSTASQRDFFERHKSAYLDKGPNFVIFQDVGI